MNVKSILYKAITILTFHLYYYFIIELKKKLLANNCFLLFIKESIINQHVFLWFLSKEN